jgi:hypothetical protein
MPAFRTLANGRNLGIEVRLRDHAAVADQHQVLVAVSADIYPRVGAPI